MKQTRVFILVFLFAAGLFIGKAFGNFMVPRNAVALPVHVRPFVPIFDGLIEEDLTEPCDSREP